MDKEQLHQRATDKTHIRHVALELASNWLASESARIIEIEQVNSDTKGLEEANSDTEGLEEAYDELFDAVQKEIEQIASELQTLAKEAEKGCMHTQPDAATGETTVHELLSKLPPHYPTPSLSFDFIPFAF